METRYLEDLKRVEAHAWSDLIFILITFISFGFSIFLFFACGLYGFIPFAVFILSVIQLILSHKKIKLEKKKIGGYYEFKLKNSYTYDSLKNIIAEIKKCYEQFDYNANSSIFFVKDKLKVRLMICNMSLFNKIEFDKIKNSINRATNKKYEIAQWLPRDVVAKMVRVNLIFTSKMNDNLEAFLSKNAGTLLRRNEAIINVAIINDTLIVPPIAGDLILNDVLRYKITVNFLTKWF